MKLKLVNIFECDELIADSIIVLNQKGYTTDFCCSGHADEVDSIRPYISFTRVGSFEIQCNDIGVPNNWVMSRDCNSEGTLLHAIIYRPFSDTEFELFTPSQLIKLAMVELTNWVNKIPDCKFVDIYNDIEMMKI